MLANSIDVSSGLTWMLIRLQGIANAALYGPQHLTKMVDFHAEQAAHNDLV